MGELRLEMREFESLTRWRWVLTKSDGTLLADHAVRLDPGCWQFEAFTDLPECLRWRVAPDKRVEDEARIIAEVGDWIGAQVLGRVGPAMVRARPATVRVIVPAEPEEARSILYLPLELGYAGGQPLAVQDVTLVMVPEEDDHAGDLMPVGDRLRVLGLFSLPEGGQALSLRREREALVRLLSGIAAVDRAVDAQMLQYGVTRARLRELMEQGEGWDVIHISGHGAPGELLLETDGGSPDPVPAGELARLLDLARERLKLVSISACSSAALTAADARRLLGLRDASDPDRPQASAADAGGVPGGAVGHAAESLATELASRLGCAVLAMRYPVVDEFAIALSAKLYDLLAAKDRALPSALGIALSEVVAVPPTAACPALSVATPALFGARAVGLRLAAPRRTQPTSYDVDAQKMAEFPPQPGRFVGRTVVMARASAALASDSGCSGVLLHGMPGGGKTACALELAYTHEHAFDRLVWFRAPDDGLDITAALADFAGSLERALPGFQMIGVLSDPARLAAFLPKLTEVCERRRVLIVADNIESLLSSTGQWRDERWDRVVAAMCGHAGLGRVVLTSRRLPAGLDARVRAEAVDALSLDEALLLARELPRLRDLMDGRLPGVERAAAQSLARHVLNIAQGHPKLLELADGQAADPARLGALAKAGEEAWQQAGGLPEEFFATGQPQAAGEDYLHVLGVWTDAVTDSLIPGHRDLFRFLCCLEQGDRIRPVTESTWAAVWTRLGRDGPPPELDAGLAALAARGLAAARAGGHGRPESYGIHPGVAAAGRSGAGTGFRSAVDAELAAYWATLANSAQEQESEQQASGLVVRAGISAAPYLLRMGQWQVAGKLLELALGRDRSRAAAEVILPAVQATVAAAEGTKDGLVMAHSLVRALEVTDRAAAERQARALLVAARAQHDYRVASAAATDLIRYTLDDGRPAEARDLAGENIRYIRKARLGPWTQLLGKVLRLQVQRVMGRAGPVFAEVRRLRAHMNRLPETSMRPEITRPWNVREALLDLGSAAAQNLDHWQDALDLNAEVVASKRARGAVSTDIARARFNDYGPLTSLGRLGEAQQVLQECQEVFEQSKDFDLLGSILSGRAEVEGKRGHGAAAIDLERTALRYAYRSGVVADVAASHHNLGNYLERHAHQPEAALVQHLAAALIYQVTGSGDVDLSAGQAARDLRAGGDVAVPENVAELCAQAAEVPGADLAGLLGKLTPDQQAVQQRLQGLIARAQALAAGTSLSG